VSIGEELKRTEALFKIGERVLEIDVGRAKVSKLGAQNAVINARETYNSALDIFKIRLGIPTETILEIVVSELEIGEPAVTEAVAVATALQYRLDLLNTLDAIDDARRQVLIAKNNLLPEFDLDGSVALDTDPNHLSGAEYNTERSTWRGMATLEIPLDRKEERNDYRSSIIEVRRAERQYDEAADRVRADVRRAIRRLEQARFNIQIQRENIAISDKQRDLAATQLDLGILQSNRDRLEAEDDLRQAKDEYAQAVSNYRRSILEFLRDTGTLRVGDDGEWIPMSEVPASAAPDAAAPKGGG
jgi:outer membrane protein TolC